MAGIDLTNFLMHGSYIGIAAVLLASGFGLPLPEDIPLLVAGLLCYHEKAYLPIMLPVVFISIMLGDGVMFYIGRRYGGNVPKIPIIGRYATKKRMEWAQVHFSEHSGKTLFIARFLPGVRAACFLTAGALHTPYWKFLLFDGMAGLLSIPLWVMAGYFGAQQFEEIRKAAMWVQIVTVAIAIVLVGGFIVWKVVRKRNADSNQ